MKYNGKAPFTHGIEIEQDGNLVPRPVLRDGWHRDGSGPMETDLGGYKNAKSVLSRFFAMTRDKGYTWDWSATARYNGRTVGCGSHAHLAMAPGVFEDDVTAWTVAFNTIIDLAPFFAPFWCHNWEDGFRNGENYADYRGRRRGRLLVNQWANPQTTRVSAATMARMVQYGNSAPGSTNYPAIRSNGARSSKPYTAEIRMSDAHPAVALTGLMLLRRVCGRAIEAGWSPKLADRDQIADVYDVIYERAAEVGLLAAMQEPMDEPIRFDDGRGIPGIDRMEFETPFDVLKAIMGAYPQTPGSWSYRVERLVFTGDDRNSPSNNNDALWRIDAPRGEFAWDNGPADPAARPPVTDDVERRAAAAVSALEA